MIYPVSEVRKFASGLDHCEGLAVARDGTVYAGGESGQVYRIAPDGKSIDIIANTGGFCLGIALDDYENIYVCDAGKRAVIKVGREGEVSIVTDSCGDRAFVNPNFGVFDSRGNFYFTDSGEWKKCNGLIYKLSPSGETSIFNGGPFHFANGLALDSTEKHLYVVESNLDRVLSIEITSDGGSGRPIVFAEGLKCVPDGIAFDVHGNLYVTTYGSSCIYRVGIDRHVELICQDLENELLCLVTNCAFGGPNFDQLITANLGHSHLSMLDLRVKGQCLWNHRVTDR